jgi:hypothetical protein
MPNRSEHVVKAAFVNCPACDTTFPAPKVFTSVQQLQRAGRMGFPAQCPNCYQMIEANQSNMSCELEPGRRKTDRDPPQR